MRHRLRNEPWIACSICDFDIPLSEAVRHYKTRKLVDRKCADALGFDDYYARVRTREGGDVSPQPVHNQGEDGSLGVGFGIGPFGETPFGDPT